MGNDKIKIDEIIFVNHLIGNKKGSFTKFKTNAGFHYQLLYKMSGEAIITFDKKTITEKADDIRFLPNPSCFDYEPEYTAKVVEQGESINIGFTSDSPLPREIFVKRYSCNQALKSSFQKMQKYWYYKREGYYYKCMSLLYDIFAQIAKAESEYVSSEIYCKIIPAIDYIDNHFTESKIDCEYLAKICGISHTYMTELFRKHLGVSPNKYIASKKIQYACDLLNTKQYTISEISQMAGFSNVYYFSKVFKNQMGICPSKFV